MGAMKSGELQEQRTPDMLPASVKGGAQDVMLETWLWAAARLLSGEKDTIAVPAVASVGPDPARWTAKPARRK